MRARKAPVLIERRDIRGAAPQVTDEGKIVGLAIPFDSWTTIGSGKRSFRERVAPGAVTKTLREGDVVLLDNHDEAKPIARKSAGTLALDVTGRGVEYEADPVDTTYARDCAANVRAGNYGGNSFGFEVVKESWRWGDDGIEERTLLEIKLPEVSVCTFPAYEDTEIGMRSAYDTAMEFRAAREESRGGDAPGNGKKPYGNVTYADPGYQSDKKKRYPINTKEHVQAAWSYINKAKNAARYTAEQLASIKAKIKAAAKKFGITISSDRSFADFELRGYDPVTGFETRDDPDGKEWAAMHEAIAHIEHGDAEAAREALQNVLDETQGAGDDDDDDDADDIPREDSAGMVAHTTQAGAAVPVRTNGEIAVAVSPRTLQRAYDLIREVTPTAQTNEALRILEPLLEAEPIAGDVNQRQEPKPGTSTSAISRDSDEGRDLDKRFAALSRKHRP